MTTIDPVVVPEPNPFLVGEMSAQSLYDKCWSLARNLWWTWHPEVINLFRDLDPIRWRQLDHNPIALLREFTPERLAARAAEDGALQPHQLRPSPAQGVHGEQADLGGLERRRARRQAGRLFLGRVRPARIDADLFRRPRRAFRRSHQECQRPGREPGRHRPVLRSGLFQAATRRQRLAARRIPRHQGRERADGAGPLAGRASRSPFASTPAPARCLPRSG